jgi:hypothetical protein
VQAIDEDGDEEGTGHEEFFAVFGNGEDGGDDADNPLPPLQPSAGGLQTHFLRLSLLINSSQVGQPCESLSKLWKPSQPPKVE